MSEKNDIPLLSTISKEHRYRIGQEVFIRNDLIGGQIYGRAFFAPSMAKYCGIITTISSIDDNGNYILADVDEKCVWTDEMLIDAEAVGHNKARSLRLYCPFCGGNVRIVKVKLSKNFEPQFQLTHEATDVPSSKRDGCPIAGIRTGCHKYPSRKAAMDSWRLATRQIKRFV